MPFEHACFISYKHPPSAAGNNVVPHYWIEFVQRFEAALQAYLTVDLTVYRDHRLKETPGIRYPRELSSRLCRSACMIAILVPEYRESNWCMAEWEAMDRLARQRLADGDTADLIIPILFRGDREEAQRFVGDRQLLDFSWIKKPSVQLGNIRCREDMEQIAERIAHFSRNLDVAVDCAGFVVSDDEESVVGRMIDPDPFRQ